MQKLLVMQLHEVPFSDCEEVCGVLSSSCCKIIFSIFSIYTTLNVRIVSYFCTVVRHTFRKKRKDEEVTSALEKEKLISNLTMLKKHPLP
jgi:hypothetical protein